MTDLTFVSPALLLLLFPVAGFGIGWIVSHIRRTARLQALMSPVMLKKLAPTGGAWRFVVQLSLVLPALILLVLAAARPQWGSRDELVFKKGSNLMIALDVSRSMLARDVHPSRLERAKVDLLDLLKALKGDRAGLVAFRNGGAVICPLTSDRAFLRQMIEGVYIDSAPRGETSIGDGIKTAMHAFDTKDNAHNAIILISDGEDLTGEATSAAGEAAHNGIVIFTVGIGDASGSHIPDEQEGSLVYQGSNVVTRLNNKTLHQIAETTGGAYIPLATSATASVTLGSLYKDHLAEIAAQEQLEQLRTRRIERYQWPLIPAIGLLIIATVFSRGRLKVKKKKAANPSNMARAVSLFLLMMLPLAASAETNRVDRAGSHEPEKESPTGRAAARRAQKFYAKGDFTAAAKAYLEAADAGTPDSVRIYKYNAAVAYLHGQEYQKAAHVFKTLTHDEKAPDGMQTGLGMALVETADAAAAEDDVDETLAKLNSAAEAFREAVRESPAPQRCNNLEHVLAELPKLREEAHAKKVMEANKKTPPQKLLNRMLFLQRDLLKKADSAVTNHTPAQIQLLEGVSEQQHNTADLWLPLSQPLMQTFSQGVTNQQQLAQIQSIMKATETLMTRAADAFRDLDPTGLDHAIRAEAGTYQLWKSIADARARVTEATRRQSNSLLRVSSPIIPPPLNETRESHQLTQRFKQQFPQWVEQMEQQANASTNVTFELSTEDRKEIERLTDEILLNQQTAIESHKQEDDAEGARGPQKKAHESLKKIVDLLPDPPKDEMGEKKRNTNRDQEKSQEEPEDPQEMEPEEQKQPEPQQQSPERDAENEQQPKEMKPEDQTPEGVREMLRRALEREKEHAEEKRKRRYETRPLPHERDW